MVLVIQGLELSDEAKKSKNRCSAHVLLIASALTQLILRDCVNCALEPLSVRIDQK